jgi:hypothetical protein
MAVKGSLLLYRAASWGDGPKLHLLLNKEALQTGVAKPPL